MGKGSDNRRGYRGRKQGALSGELAKLLAERKAWEESVEARINGLQTEAIALRGDIADNSEKVDALSERVEKVEPKPRPKRTASSTPRPKRPTTREIAREEAENLMKGWFGAFAGQVRRAIIFFTILVLGLVVTMGALYYLGEKLQNLDFELGIAGTEIKIAGLELGSEISELKSEVGDAELAGKIARLRGETHLQKELIAQLNDRITSLEERVASLEGQLPVCEGSYVVESGETVWGILKGKLGRNPTGSEIQTVVDLNHLSSYTSAGGTWIVLIYPGQTLKLGTVVCGGD